MLKIRDILRPQTLEEAQRLLLEPEHRAISGGTLFQLQSGSCVCVDVAPLLESGVTVNGGAIRLGAMTTLRELERSALPGAFSILPRAVSQLRGPALRNLATIGGAVAARFPQSELLTALLALDARVTCFPGGELSLEEYLALRDRRRIVLAVSLEQRKGSAGAFAVRSSAATPPLLCAAARYRDGVWRIAVGARPQVARVWQFPEGEAPTRLAQRCAEQVPVGGDLEASAAYRREICPAVILRAMEECGVCK